MTPKVSIVIPAYNAMRFLPQTVESALTQTWRDFELLVVDDGSSDDTRAWVAQHLDARVRLVRQNHGGTARARNRGISEARGDYIAFLDADDLWNPTKLEKQVACLEARPDVGLVHTAIRYIDENGSEIGQVLRSEGNGDVWEQVVLHMLVRCGSTPLIRRACFSEVGVFDPGLEFAEDWDMWIRIAADFHFAVLDEPLVAYRQHRANITRRYQMIMPNLERVLERAFSSVPTKNNRLKKKAYAHAYLFAAQRAFNASDLDEAASLLHQAFRCYPRLRYRKNSLKLSFQLRKAGWLEQARGRN